MKNLVLALSISLMGQFASAQGLSVIEGVKAVETLVNTTSKSVEAVDAVSNLSQSLKAMGSSISDYKALDAVGKAKLVSKMDAVTLKNINYQVGLMEGTSAEVKGAAKANKIVESSLANGSTKSKSLGFKIGEGFSVSKTADAAMHEATLTNYGAIADVKDPAVRAIKEFEAGELGKIAKMEVEKGIEEASFARDMQKQCEVGTTEEIATIKAGIADEVEDAMRLNDAIDTHPEVVGTMVDVMESKLNITKKDAAQRIQKLEKCGVVTPATAAEAGKIAAGLI